MPNLNMFLLPQVAFAATCAGAVFFYVLNNIDEIKEKQAQSIGKAMSEQAATVKNVQEVQQEAIAKAKKQQEENTKRAQAAAAEAKARADELTKRR